MLKAGYNSKLRFSILLTMILLVFSSSTYAEEKITLASGGSATAQVSIAILKDVYERAGIALDIKVLPAQRCLEESNSGRLDGEVNRIPIIEKKYPNLIRVPVPINYLETVVISKKITFVVKGWDSLKPYSIVIRRGLTNLEEKTKGLNVKSFTDDEQLKKLILNERYDVWLTSRLVGLSEIKKKKVSGIKILEPPIESLPLYHYLHKKHKDLVPRINSVLLEMQKEGLIKKIRNQYIEENLK